MIIYTSFASEIILKNWLLNPTGDPNFWVELDLVQEHLNYWIKVLELFFILAVWCYSPLIRLSTRHTELMPHGNGFKKSHLGVEILRNLANCFNDVLGVDVGKRHAPPNLTNDIETLMDSLEDYGV
jgi:hypothetical protein